MVMRMLRVHVLVYVCGSFMPKLGCRLRAEWTLQQPGGGFLWPRKF